jgi:hypothetical protein
MSIEPWRPQPFSVHREASWARDGFNRDWRYIAPGEAFTLAEVAGPGVVTRFWLAFDHHTKRNWLDEKRFTVADPFYLRNTVLQIFWEGSDTPSVSVPVGDFFGVGHGQARSYTSDLFSVSVDDQAGRPGSTCWIEMPFHRAARFVLRNDSDERVRAFFHIDYQKWASLPADTYHFHASWRCQMPCVPTPLEADGSMGANLSGAGNYVILSASGEGSYIGCNLSVDNHAGGWWGEGDDMIFVDGEDFPGSLHGTGTEEVFGQCWGLQDIQFPRFGTTVFNTGHEDWEGRWTMYRHRDRDPIPFRKSIRVTVEHGHNNHRADDYSSTAYWYQKGPVGAPDLPAAADRWPRTP